MSNEQVKKRLTEVMAGGFRAYEIKWVFTVLALRCEVEMVPSSGLRTASPRTLLLEQAQPLLGNWLACTPFFSPPTEGPGRRTGAGPAPL